MRQYIIVIRLPIPATKGTTALSGLFRDLPKIHSFFYPAALKIVHRWPAICRANTYPCKQCIAEGYRNLSFPPFAAGSTASVSLYAEFQQHSR